MRRTAQQFAAAIGMSAGGCDDLWLRSLCSLRSTRWNNPLFPDWFRVLLARPSARPRQHRPQMPAPHASQIAAGGAAASCLSFGTSAVPPAPARFPRACGRIAWATKPARFASAFGRLCARRPCAPVRPSGCVLLPCGRIRLFGCLAVLALCAWFLPPPSPAKSAYACRPSRAVIPPGGPD